MRRAQLLGVLGLAGLVASDAAAIVRRHDVPDSAYRADAAAFPALFALNRTRLGHRDCVATLIADRWAITAAHCTEGRALREALAAGGRGYRVEIDGRDAFIDQVVRHPDSAITRPLNPRWADLALLRLSAPVTGVAPIALYEGQDEVGQTVLIPGWGDRGDGLAGIGEPDGLFRVAENRIDSVIGNYLSWRFDDPRAAPSPVAREGISGPGDSGGPALVRTSQGWVTLGVSSHQDTHGGREGRYGVEERYVRVSAFLPWIRSRISGD